MPPLSLMGISRNSSNTSRDSAKSVQKSKPLIYGSSSKPPKASASTSIARETIFGDNIPSERAPDLERFNTQKVSDTDDSRGIVQPGLKASSDSDPDSDPGPGMAPGGHGRGDQVDSVTGQDKAGTQLVTDIAKKDSTLVRDAQADAVNERQGTQVESCSQQDRPAIDGKEDTKTAAQGDVTTATTSAPPVASSSWLGWWSSPASSQSSQLPQSPEPAKKVEDNQAEQLSTVVEVNQALQPTTVTSPKQDDTSPNQQIKPDTMTDTSATQNKSKQPSAPPATSWFGFWPYNSQTDVHDENIEDQSAAQNITAEPLELELNKAVNDVQDTDQSCTTPEPPKDVPEKKKPETPKAGSTWAFWSRDSPKSTETGKDTTKDQAEQEPGEIAVMGEGSQNHPKPMAVDISDTSSKPTIVAKTVKEAQGITKSLSWRRSNKQGRLDHIESDSKSGSVPQNASSISSEVGRQKPRIGYPSTSTSTSTGSVKTKTKAQPKVKTELPTDAASVQLPPNLLLPSFESTYRTKEDTSMLRQVTSWLLRTHQPPANHIYRTKTTPKIHKAIAIGVHGLFPATYLRPMIGQPTGTSLRFASLGAEAIRRWADSHGCSNCEIEKVALEGEGKINERVDNLWKLLLNWIEHIRTADVVLIACHSQGVPVSMMLLEKLIDLGIVTNAAKVGVCAMAGVALGPFPEYKSSFFMGSAAELWEFGNPTSQNAQRFEGALKKAVDFGIRITFIGSIDDQVVPLESAIYSPANHPYIYRAVFIDGRVHAPDFIAHLVGFALKLRNLGISDHGLIRELSLPLAGSLYSGEGHSRLYFDPAVYDLAVVHCLETTSLPSPVAPCVVVHPRDVATDGSPSSSLNSSTPAATAATTTTASAGATTTPTVSATAQSSNPYVLPWIMRGMLEEEFVKNELGGETEELLRQFDSWRPINKALKDVKYRLEAVRSKL